MYYFHHEGQRVSQTGHQQEEIRESMLLNSSLFSLHFDLEDEGSTFLLNPRELQPSHMTLHLRRHFV
jgi:hypothetical protein